MITAVRSPGYHKHQLSIVHFGSRRWAQIKFTQISQVFESFDMICVICGQNLRESLPTGRQVRENLSKFE